MIQDDVVCVLFLVWGHSITFNVRSSISIAGTNKSQPATVVVEHISTTLANATTIVVPVTATTSDAAEIINATVTEVANDTLAANLGCESQQDDDGGISLAGIAGITLGCISVIAIVSMASFVVYRNYGFNRPQVLNDRFSNPDSSAYIDDSTVRENSEEMYSLDNDSFLNSLEAMTIQNLWTDTVKHTKL